MTQPVDDFPAIQRHRIVSRRDRVFTLVMARFISVVYAVLGRANLGRNQVTPYHSPTPLDSTMREGD